MLHLTERFPKPATHWGRRLLIAALVGSVAGLAAALLDWAIRTGSDLLIGRFTHLAGRRRKQQPGMEEISNFGFPFGINGSGRVQAGGGDEAIRGKIIQVLFTARGERVHRPEFGCGLFNLVFEPNNEVLAAAVEFTIGQALTRWLRDEIIVDGVRADSSDETIQVEVAYTRRKDLVRQAVRIQFR